MKATFQFVEPFDLFAHLSDRAFPCDLQATDETSGTITLNNEVNILGVVIREITFECRYEGDNINLLLDGKCINVNGLTGETRLIGVICPIEFREHKT
jgi:hypothetical protein